MADARQSNTDQTDTAPVTQLGAIRLRTLVLTRWIGIAGQAAAVLVVRFAIGFEVPLEAALAVIGASAALNIAMMVARPAGARLDERAAAWFLAFDIAQLAMLLYLTGGLQNPFSFLLLAPVTVSATILSLGSTIALCALALASISALAGWHMPLPWNPGGFALPLTYVLGMWVALALGIVFVASYGWRVAEEARRMSAALVATQLALAREQRLASLGGLAAAAAHELGTPLGTIAIAAREIARDLPKDSPIAEDARLLLEQTARCRDILADLSRNADGRGDDPFHRLTLAALVEAAAAPYATSTVELALDAAPSDSAPDTPPPLVGRSPEIIHGLANLIQNAVQFARSRVTVETRWSPADITVTIRDDGPGFPPGVLERLGEPYFSARSQRGAHMGLGVFIATNLLERSGAALRFANRPVRSGLTGAQVVVRWNRPLSVEERPR